MSGIPITAQKKDTTHSPTESAIQNISFENISVGHLLGRDYVFLNTDDTQKMFSAPTANTPLIRSLLTQLNLSEQNTLFVCVENQLAPEPRFTRQELEWLDKNLVQIDSVTLSSSEQQNFMKMIWLSSSPALT